jgi:hypothetical protein
MQQDRFGSTQAAYDKHAQQFAAKLEQLPEKEQ